MDFIDLTSSALRQLDFRLRPGGTAGALGLRAAPF